MDELTNNGIKAVGNYIVKRLTALKYKRNKTHKVHIICMYAGEATIETEGILAAKRFKNFDIGTVYLIDVYSPKVPPPNEITLARRLNAEKIVAGTFEDIVKIFMNMPIGEFKYGICMGVHPQLIAFGESKEDMRAILNALNINYNDDYNASKKFLEITKKIGRKYIGILYKLILVNFDKEIAYIWRDGKVCSVSKRDFDENLTNVDAENARAVVGKRTREKCVTMLEKSPSVMTRIELYEEAKKRNIKNRSKMSKEQLLQALS